MTGTLELDLPQGWKVSPKSHIVTLNTRESAQVFTFELEPEAEASSGSIRAFIKSGNEVYDRSLVNIEYPHIHTQTLFPKAIGKVVNGNLEVNCKRVAYIMGAGDNVPEAIEQLGVSVDLLDPANLASTKLDEYDAVVVGIRAYNTQQDLAKFQEILLEYVEKGGLMVVQYSTYHGMVIDQVGPYPMEKPGRRRRNNRVTDETAEVKFLDPDHPLMNKPNAIEKADFDNWVQERGLYFPEKWDDQYTALLRWSDPGEDDLDGALLVADYGKGKFVYTGISFFRQLPAGVPGAFKLWANILSYGNGKK